MKLPLSAHITEQGGFGWPSDVRQRLCSAVGADQFFGLCPGFGFGVKNPVGQDIIKGTARNQFSGCRRGEATAAHRAA